VLSTIVLVAAAAIIIVTTADTGSGPRSGPGTTVEALSAASGGTEVFTTAVAFVGTFLFVVFVGVTAAEFSRGTMRTMLLRQPRRVRLLAGRLVALVAFSGAILLFAEVVTWLVARAVAPGQGIDTSEWVSLAALGHGLADFASVLVWVAAYATFGTTLAVLLRSVPIAVGVAIAWAGPFEHILQDAWSPATKVFPGLLLEAFVSGGTTQVTAGQALTTVAAYAVVAAAIGALVFQRRDVMS
jgi:ABC-type transport system involved in multi-copper enzyme maturation permease subunit